MKPTISIVLLSSCLSLQAEPIISSWYLDRAGSYARTAYLGYHMGDAATDAGNPSSGAQTTPAYAGVQGVYYSTTYVYIRSTGLGVSTMGPWYQGDRTTLFISWPANSKLLYRFPRTTNYAINYTGSTSETGGGSAGLMVDGVPIYNSWDARSYNDLGVWNRDAWFNEGQTFDSGYAHQAGPRHHYHANPVGLRHLLGDSVDYDPTVTYTGIGGNSPDSENFNGKHSPILGWVNDGLPMYGPYGYSDPTSATSGVRRMVSGYQLRDGTNGSTNLPSTGRTTRPQWKIDLDPAITDNVLTPAQYGLAAATTGQYRLGAYLEDNEYKGYLISPQSSPATMALYTNSTTQGAFDENKHFDLNLYNVRYCVTPEFPNGTWAYFQSILANGTPAFPYGVGFYFFGTSNAGGSTASIPTNPPLTTVYDGPESREMKSEEILATEGGNVTIQWDAIEGGTYRVDTSTTLQTNNWAQGTSFTSTSQRFKTNDPFLPTTTPNKFYRLVRTGVATYDSVISTGGGGPPR